MTIYVLKERMSGENLGIFIDPKKPIEILLKTMPHRSRKIEYQVEIWDQAEYSDWCGACSPEIYDVW